MIGIDEAGRGPWAGPVTAAAFWINREASLPADLNDSKKLSREQRAAIETDLADPKYGHLWAVHHSPVSLIDEIGILGACFEAMREACTDLVQALKRRDAKPPLPPIPPIPPIPSIIALVDGNREPDLPVPCHTLIKGDQLSLSIAAASIMAKQARDRLMGELAQTYPHYGWQTNQGYGTKAHSDGLEAHGISPHHRQSFAPIKKYLTKT